jgi:NADP-dependent 3-hydroxy acid dehydrogenase YdfG
MDVRNRTAVVTGAGSGIGRATAIELARRGANVALTDVHADRLVGTRAAVEGLGRRASVHVFDVSDRTAWERFRDEVVADHGEVHLLMNNAGVALTGPFLQCTPEELQWQLDVNLRGVMHGCHVMLPHLLERDEAHLVNVSSLFGLITVPDSAAYCMSKHAVKALSHALMMELPDHVHVTSVHPGAVATRITADGRFRAGGGVSHRGSQAMIAGGVSPEHAGRLVADAIARDAEELIIGRDAYLLSSLRWLLPRRHRALLKRWRRRRQARYARSQAG